MDVDAEIVCRDLIAIGAGTYVADQNEPTMIVLAVAIVDWVAQRRSQ